MLFIIIAAVFCGLDQLLKYWITTHIGLGGEMEFIPGVLGLTNVRNTGMAFSLLSEHTWLLACISVVVIIFLIVLVLRKGFTFWEKLALCMIMGGAAGNAIDRLVLGYVVDMFHVKFVNFAVFNLADAFIDVGAVLFVVLYIVRSCKEEKKSRKAPEEPEKNNNAEGETIDDPDNGK